MDLRRRKGAGMTDEQVKTFIDGCEVHVSVSELDRY